VDSFSFPYRFPEEDKAFMNRLVMRISDAGYRNSESTQVRTLPTQSEVNFLKRFPVNSGDDLSLFQTKLEGAYDWVHVPQYHYKKLGSKVGHNV
jgi:hypothetical protein